MKKKICKNCKYFSTVYQRGPIDDDGGFCSLTGDFDQNYVAETDSCDMFEEKNAEQKD